MSDNSGHLMEQAFAPRDCKHGHLARQCVVCQLERDLATADAQIAALREANAAFAAEEELVKTTTREAMRRTLEAESRAAELERDCREMARLIKALLKNSSATNYIKISAADWGESAAFANGKYAEKGGAG